jgi:hypothetical protein
LGKRLGNFKVVEEAESLNEVVIYGKHQKGQPSGYSKEKYGKENAKLIVLDHTKWKSMKRLTSLTQSMCFHEK